MRDYHKIFTSYACEFRFCLRSAADILIKKFSDLSCIILDAICAKTLGDFECFFEWMISSRLFLSECALSRNCSSNHPSAICMKELIGLECTIDWIRMDKIEEEAT